MKKSFIVVPLISSVLLTASINLHAEGLIESITGTNVNDSSTLKSLGIEVGGWAAAGVTFASHNGDHNSNAPISFNDRINELQLNQLNLFIERAVNTEGSGWDIGGRVDFMFGTDASKTQAGDWDNNIIESTNNYDIALPQAYVEIFAPVGNGLTAKIGHFYTNIGYEVVTAPDNFFYSHAYTMLYAEPFTHSGALLSYQVNDNISVSGGVVSGWDNYDNNEGNWSFLGGASWASDDGKTGVAVAVINGENGADADGRNTTMYSIVFNHDFADNWHYVLQHDLGVTEAHAGLDDDSDWFGVNQYLTHDLNDELAVGLRAEWFSDSDGRVSGIGGNYYAVSLGLNYSPLSWLKLRPEVRYDWVDTNGAGNVFDGGNESDQLAIAMDMVITF